MALAGTLLQWPRAIDALAPEDRAAVAARAGGPAESSALQVLAAINALPRDDRDAIKRELRVPGPPSADEMLATVGMLSGAEREVVRGWVDWLEDYSMACRERYGDALPTIE